MSDFQPSTGQPDDEREEHPLAVGEIGELFRRTREARGESLVDVAYALKMSPRQIEAIEAERFDLLPGAVFIKGFLKNYARHLGLDPEPMLAALRRDQPAQAVRLTPVTNATGAVPIGGEDRKLLKPVAIVILGMVVVLAAGWYFDWFRIGDIDTVPVRTEQSGFPPAAGDQPEPPAETEMPARPLAVLPEVIESVSPEVLRMEPDSTESTAADAVEAVTPEPGSEPAQEAARAQPETPAPEAPALEAPVSEAPAPEALVPEAPAPEADAGDGTATEPVPASGERRLVFRMQDESWIQVRDGSGASLYTGTGAAGSTRTVQGNPPFAIVVGNAGVVTLEFDGQPVDLKANTSPGGVARMTIR